MGVAAGDKPPADAQSPGVWSNLGARWRGWIRRRILWADWQRDDRPDVMVLVRHRPRRSLSVKYWSPEPGFYRVRLPKGIPGEIDADLSERRRYFAEEAARDEARVRQATQAQGADEHGRSEAAAEAVAQPALPKWEAQFGRQRGTVISCSEVKPTAEDPKGADGRTVVGRLEVKFERNKRRSPDGVFDGATRAKPGAVDVGHPDADDVRALYSEVAAAWRQLTDVRFKLLAFLPFVTGLGVFQLVSSDSAVSAAPRWARVAAAAFGLVITVALFVYERRNSELYNDLIARGKHIEHQLGATSGVFLGRLGSRKPIQHEVALFAVYWASIAAWLGVLIGVLAGAGERDQGDEALGADFSYAVSYVDADSCEVEEIRFTDTSTGEVTSWLWEFPDDSTSPERDATFDGYTAGAISLTVQGPSATATVKKTPELDC